MHPVTRGNVIRQLNYGWSVEDVANTNGIELEDVQQLKAGLKPRYTSPSYLTPLQAARQKMLDAGYDPAVVKANFG